MSLKFKILVSDPLSKEGIDLLKSIKQFDVQVLLQLTPKELQEIIADYDALLIRSGTQVNQELLKRARKLKMIGRAGIGIDNVDVKAAHAANIVVMNTPYGNTITTAEHTISLLMSLARHIPQATANLKSGRWEKTQFQGTEINNKVLGILGLGNIGSVVAKLAGGLGMRVLAYDPAANTEKADLLGASLVDLDKLYTLADFISVHVPLSSSTHHLLAETAFNKMKTGVRIINAARGGIIDEVALLNALNKNHVAGAALDVFEQEPPPADYALLHHPRVIATPHLGASTKEAQDRVALQIAEHTCDFFLKNKINNAINILGSVDLF